MRRRFVLASSLPFSALHIYSTSALEKLVEDGFLGYYALKTPSLFCVTHLGTYYQDTTTSGGMEWFGNEDCSRFLAIYDGLSPMEPLKRSKTGRHVLMFEPTIAAESAYRALLQNDIVSITVHNRLVNDMSFFYVEFYRKFDLIILRMKIASAEQSALLTSFGSTAVEASDGRTVVLCYTDLDDPDVPELLTSTIDGVFPLRCKCILQFKHLLSACILSTNRDLLKSSLGATSF